jgi:hypothetical protein
MDLEEIRQAIESLPTDQQSALARWLRGKLRVRKPRIPDQRVFFRSPALLWTVACLLLFLLAEGFLFRLGWYNKYLEPDSTAGTVESYLYWLKRFPHGQLPEVLVMGDSRIAEGFSARAADQAAGNRLRYWNFGMGGAVPRVWYYVLRDGDPTRRRFAAIVIALDQYSDQDSVDSIEDRFIDLNFVIGRLRLSDCGDFAASMRSRETQARVLSGCLLRGISLRHDAQDFLQHFQERIRRSKDWRINGLGYVNAYGGREENLLGLSADFVNRAIHFPPGLDAERHDTVQAMVMPTPARQTGETTRYRKLWLGRILDLYKDSPTRIVFLELPRAPIPIPESTQPATFLEWALQRPRVSALPATTFRDLERPELFFDGLHLNSAGRGIFTGKIAAQIPPLIGIH